MSNIRMQINPHNNLPTFLIYDEDYNITQIEAEDEVIYTIKGMLVEYLEGLFYGLVEKPTKKNNAGEVIDSKLISTGIVFTPHEIDQVLFFMTGETFI